MKIQPILAVAAIVGTMGLAAPAPAQADTAASTRNIILGVAAAVAGIAIEANVNAKNARANTVEGYLPDGATVYQDGRVVEPNGSSWYPGNQGQQISCNGQSCQISSQTGYNGNGYNGAAYDANGNNNTRWQNRSGWSRENR